MWDYLDAITTCSALALDVNIHRPRYFCGKKEAVKIRVSKLAA